MKQVIVLTGGIASGKTFVSNYLAKLGAHVIDTDIIARQLLQENGNQYSDQAIAMVKQQFGDAILSHNEIDRKKLRSLIFNDAAAKQMLEGIMHPLILKEVHAALQNSEGNYDLIVVPLLKKDSPYLALATQVLVIEVDPGVQLQRVMARDQIDEVLAKQIIQSQATNLERRAFANTIIINTSEVYTRNVLKQLDKEYSLARSKEVVKSL